MIPSPAFNPLLTPPFTHLQILLAWRTIYHIASISLTAHRMRGLLFPGPRTPELQRHVANIIKSQPAARQRWETGGGGGRGGGEKRTLPAQAHYHGSLPSVLPIRAQSNILLHYSPISAPYQPRGPKGLASTVGRGNVSSTAICGDGRTYWKSKQEQEEAAEGRSPGSGLDPLYPGITAL